ncbi:MAG TPA: GntR family transcriptional regulator [Spirochaetota bacterium]|nr:GntR family transcriptional regulator [Spirochaetota bacterium]
MTARSGNLKLIRAIETPLPVYYRLQEALKKKIEDGNWKPGQLIPSERLIAGEHQVSVGTVRKAVLNLVYEGYLFRIQGKGTYVAGTKLRKDSLRYYRMMEALDGGEAELEIRFIGLKEIQGFDPASALLGHPRDRTLYELRRLFLHDGAPLVYCESYLPKGIFRDFDSFPPARFEKSTLYEMIEQTYGLPCIYNHELFGAVAAHGAVAKQLGVNAGSPLLFIEMRSFTYKDRPYEFRRSYCVTGTRRVFAEI